MPEFCDVALPVPLDMAFTYRVPADATPVVGGRVLVPFRQQRMTGIVVELHDRGPSVATKNIISVLDAAPVLDEQLLRLGRWIADYYLAPVGEVFRTMLPLGAEFKRSIGYRITEDGQMALHLAGMSGSSARSRRTPEEQAAEFRVLDYLAAHDNELGGAGMTREETLRSATRVSRAILNGMVRKKWIAREDVSAPQTAARTVKFAVLKSLEGKLNENQRSLVDTLAASGGKVTVTTLQALEVPRTTLSTLIRRGLVEIAEQPAEFTISRAKPRPSPLEFDLNAEQRSALARLREGVEAHKFSGMLLHGVTGSGKTAVYLAGMRAVLEAGRSAILLVPEIGLTPAVAADLHQIFGDEVAILHSALSDRERAEQWHRIRRGGARMVVGTRSAVFAPVSDLALIIVDEEHDASYKQEETPRYHARDVAVMRAKMANAAVVLGSATPSLESYFNATKNKYALVELPDRVEQRPLPEVEIVDMRQEFQETGREQVVSRRLAAEIRERLERREQVMVLLNRRGYSPVVLCRTCGKKLECVNCAIALTHHKREHKMVCHYCGYTAPVPKACVHCGSEYVYFLGTGSEKLEELLHGMFPQARIARLDRDTVRGHEDFESTLNALNEGELDVVVGTQMIAKGHDIHGVTLVGVVGADVALGLPDFRAAERTFQLLTQVAGRAGRGQSPGKVILQTYFQDHYAVQYAARHDFVGFYEKELRFRSWMHYPPYSALANVLVRSDKLDDALQWSGMLGKWFDRTRHEAVRVLGPAAAPILKLKRDYRYHFVLKSPSREKLNTTLRAMLAYAAQQKIPRTQVIVDVDALWLM
ncbi:Replication restart DNA helicase PriA [Candidatus Sulfotelmatobacter kueseliae]|uniref:Replication restart protein PriA n=1 Tax=Candidatus Sulfotelmatobacter kueseliae TaxID=2042962 RepID=A0A2U3JV74_9BACT|nr:Replication restart DNA helicase PriA [Candidatus Sulfotelmatobacter kueseliae]